MVPMDPSAGHAEKTLRDFGRWLRSCPATSGKRFVFAGNHDFWLEDSRLGRGWGRLGLVGNRGYLEILRLEDFN